MERSNFAGAMIRMMRLEKNWSQETLCKGICAVSYLSKIEQGKVCPNNELLEDLFSRLGICWHSDTCEEGSQLCEAIYGAVFSGNQKLLVQQGNLLSNNWDRLAFGPRYMDFITLKAYCSSDISSIPTQMFAFMDDRQRCLLHILQEAPEEAWMRYPCAFTSMAVGVHAYRRGNYTLALEYLQRSYDLACQQGYVHLMMVCHVFIANCYSDLKNLDAMRNHCLVAKRLAQVLGEAEMERNIDYNMASTKIECGNFEDSYAYFSSIPDPTALELHKLAICCEKLGKPEEALAALSSAEKVATEIDALMCDLVRYRLDNPNYLHDQTYGKQLLETFHTLQKERPAGFARFHLPWIEEWCAANRQYRLAYEILRDFT